MTNSKAALNAALQKPGYCIDLATSVNHFPHVHELVFGDAQKDGRRRMATPEVRTNKSVLRTSWNSARCLAEKRTAAAQLG
jgi:hypothetical protein